MRHTLLCALLAFGLTPWGLAASPTAAMDASKVSSHKTIQPWFFGFNIELLEFELGFADAGQAARQRSLVTQLAAFEGAAYRFAGGNSGNVVRLEDTLQAANQRRPVKIVDWHQARPIAFGLPEYLQFLQKVRGTAWIQLNLVGDNITSPDTPARLAQSADKVAAHLQNNKVNPLRWELGNELERGPIKWAPEEIAARATAVAKPVLARYPDARFALLYQEYPAMASKGYSASRFNQAQAKLMSALPVEPAFHFYFDGVPSGLSLPEYLGRMKAGVKDIQQATDKPVQTAWITEFGRVPEHAFEAGWEARWDQTADLDAALGVADMMISAARDPYTQGAFVHALHATRGPWPLFRAVGPDEVRPTWPLKALTLLRQSLLPRVLAAPVQTTNTSGYRGGYDFNGLALASEDDRLLNLWLVNRAPDPLRLTLRLPVSWQQAITNKQASIVMNTLAGTDERAEPRKEAVTCLAGTSDTGCMMTVPARAVVTLQFSRTDRTR
jgi:hypothetical protein